MPDFRRVDAMPARDLARTQQVIDGRRTSSSVWAQIIAKGLAVEAALGMRLQVESRDDFVCRHGIAPSGGKGLGPSLRLRAMNSLPQPSIGRALCCLSEYHSACRGLAKKGVVAMRAFRLLVTLVAAVAASAVGQNLTPTVGPASGATQSAASIPDFSGVWSHPFLTGFEPPQSGPGPVRNRSRRPDGVANFQQLVGDYTNPILKPQAAEVVKKHGEITLSGNGYPTP